jgi:hypothetical protein
MFPHSPLSLSLHSRPHRRDLQYRAIATISKEMIASRRVTLSLVKDLQHRVTATISRETIVSSRALRDPLSRDRTIALEQINRTELSPVDITISVRVDLTRTTDSRALPERSSSLNLSFVPRL